MKTPVSPTSLLRIEAVQLDIGGRGTISGVERHWLHVATAVPDGLMYNMGLGAAEAARQLPDAVTWYRSQGMQIGAVALERGCETGPVAKAAQALGLSVHLDGP
jgi:hypothetical protein